MQARRWAEASALISATLLEMSDQLVAMAALKGVGRDHVAWGARSVRGAGLDGTCCRSGSLCCRRRC